MIGKSKRLLPPQPRPTESELEILQILWRNGPATVRLVNDELNKTRSHSGRGAFPQPHSGHGAFPQPVGYTTTLKLMQIMLEKGLVTRDESARSHLYAAAVPEMVTQKQILDRLVQSAFGGSAAKLVMQALGGHKASQREITQIREILDRLEGGKNGRSH